MGSLDQLDDSLIRPIFLVGVRLDLAPAGRTLPELLLTARAALRTDNLALADFNSRLIHAGFIDQMAASYTRRFSIVTLRLLPVFDDFPRLTRGNVPLEIRAARYDLDLDLVQCSDTTFESALKQIGVI